MLLENCREVADFFSDLVEAVGDVSLQLQPDDSVTMLEGMVHPYKGRNTSTLLCACSRTSLHQPVLTLLDTSSSVTAQSASTRRRWILLMELESLDRRGDAGLRETDSAQWVGWRELLWFSSCAAGCETVRNLLTHTHAHARTLARCVRNWSTACQDVSYRDEWHHVCRIRLQKQTPGIEMWCHGVAGRRYVQ